MTEATRPIAPSFTGAKVFAAGATLIALLGNLIPLAGVLFWGWDTFQLLMLYWTETVIVAFWTLMRIATLPARQLGTLTVNGVVRTATNLMMVGFFCLHAGMFIFVHLVFLLVLFSGAWFKKAHGVGGFFSELYLTNGVWVALLFMFVASWISFLLDRRSGQNADIESTTDRAQADAKKPEGDAVGRVVGTLYARIVIMQFAIIFGGWWAMSAGSLAPLLLVIGLKTLFDLAAGAVAMSFTSTSTSVVAGTRRMTVDTKSG